MNFGFSESFLWVGKFKVEANILGFAVFSLINRGAIEAINQVFSGEFSANLVGKRRIGLGGRHRKGDIARDEWVLASAEILSLGTARSQQNFEVKLESGDAFWEFELAKNFALNFADMAEQFTANFDVGAAGWLVVGIRGVFGGQKWLDFVCNPERCEQ